MPIAEQLKIECVEFFSAWNGLVSRAANLSASEQEEFFSIATQIGLMEKISRMREICERPEEAIERGEDTERLFSDASVDLILMDRALETSLRLGVNIRDAMRAVAENEKERLTLEEEQRNMTANRSFVVPALIAVAGGIFSTVLGIVIQKSVG